MTSPALYEVLMQPGTDPAEILAQILRRPAWMADAACRGMGVDEFFPRRGDDSRPAKAVCAGCLVRDECLAFAFEHEGDGMNLRVGVWGGTSALQRKALAPQNRARAA